MPTSSPAAFTSAPPELPGLIDASVWIAWYDTEDARRDSPGTVTFRSRADTMPVVTVPCSPDGEPMAITASPTFTEPESAHLIGVRPEAPETCSTARSEEASVLTTVAGSSQPSLNFTVIWPPAEAPTWLVVRILPSAE